MTRFTLFVQLLTGIPLHIAMRLCGLDSDHSAYWIIMALALGAIGTVMGVLGAMDERIAKLERRGK